MRALAGLHPHSIAAVNEILKHGHIVSGDISRCENKMKRNTKKKQPEELLRALRGAAESERILHRLHSVVLVLNGFSSSEAARLYGDSARSVAYWVKRFEEHGVGGLEEKQRSGRPSKLSESQMRSVKSWVRKSFDGTPVTGKVLSSYIRSRFGLSLTVRQCRRIMKTISSHD